MDEFNGRETITASAAKSDAGITREIRDISSEIRDKKNTKAFLESENRRYIQGIDALKAEIAGMDIMVLNLEKDIEAGKPGIDGFQGSVQRLEEKRESLMDDVNGLMIGIKSVTEDVTNCNSMRRLLQEELDDIKTERNIITSRLKTIESELKKIQEKKALEYPYLKSFDLLLKRMRNAAREVENRMDVSMKLLPYEGKN
jgi:chromosome segregation ATPase